MIIDKILLSLVFAQVALCGISVDKQQYLRDSVNNKQGNIRIFHGVNVVYKPAPYYPETGHFDPMTSFSREDCEILRDLGFNVIRLHVAFEAGMPQKGEVNDTYLLKVREIVRMANEYQIWVILDAHQDLLNRQFCGEGFPDWAIKRNSFPFPQKVDLRFDENGYPLIEDCLKKGFASYYLTEDVGRNFEAIYHNEDGVADMFGLFWRRTVELMREEPNVLGYEMLNEPVAGDWTRSKIDFVWPGWGNTQIMGFYKLVNKYIREVDSEKLVFFEPYFTDVLGGGFKENVGGKQYEHLEVLSYHIYCTLEEMSMLLCKELHSIFYNHKEKNMKRLHVGGFLSEFGALPNTDYGAEAINDLLSKAEHHQQSWTYWQYKGFNDYTTSSDKYQEGIFNVDGTLQDLKINALVRPYAYQICASTLHQSKFDHKKAIYTLHFHSKAQCTNQTLLYIPANYHYTNGFHYDCNHCQLVQLSPQYYALQHQEGEQEIKLTIKRKN